MAPGQRQSGPPAAMLRSAPRHVTALRDGYPLRGDTEVEPEMAAATARHRLGRSPTHLPATQDLIGRAERNNGGMARSSDTGARLKRDHE
jgi:hypothetical protein